MDIACAIVIWSADGKTFNVGTNAGYDPFSSAIKVAGLTLEQAQATGKALEQMFERGRVAAFNELRTELQSKPGSGYSYTYVYKKSDDADPETK